MSERPSLPEGVARDVERTGEHPPVRPSRGRALGMLALLVPRDLRALGRMSLCLAIGGFAGWIAVPDRPMPLAAPAPLPVVTLDGKPLSLDGTPQATLEQARAIARTYVRGSLKVGVGTASLVRTREELGARIENERLVALVEALHDPGSPLRRAHAQHIAAGVARPLPLPLPVTIDGQRALGALIDVKDDLDKAPVDARIDLVKKAIAKDEPGRRVDVYATLALIDAALVNGEPQVEAVVETVPAARTADKIGDVPLDDVLGYFETKYTPDMKHEARTYNLRLAASKLDGYVIMPGETFDFNEVVGARSEANGYKMATVIAQGELADGIGGGTCQIAGTLHGAAFFAGLDIVERKPHTRPSFYIKMGMDATVVYPTITLRLRNPFSFPIVLHETVRGGVVRAEILGLSRTRDVTYVRKINEVVPFIERDAPDPKLPKGTRVLAQRGIPGFKITRYRIVRDGSIAVREKMSDVYPATNQIWRVGTGEDVNEKQAKPGDDHPEYVADEYLLISQGPTVVNPRTNATSSEPGGATVESRVAGRYGTKGWTVREGFAKPHRESNDSNDTN